MSKGNRPRQSVPQEPSGRGGRSGRWEEKRQRFADSQRGEAKRSRPLGTSTYLTIGAIALVVVFVGLMTFRNSSGNVANAAPLQQVPATTAATEGGRVSISAEEVAGKKLVAWDYKQGSTSVPLLAYTTPSGATKVAIRMCEPCNGFSFRVEGNQLVCNSCGTRWDLETSKGISGGCQGYPPEVMPSLLEGGKLFVDEQKVANWKPRA